MGLAAEQLELRRQGIGASEVASVLGIGGFGTPLSVYMQKLGLPDAPHDEAATEWGNRHEPTIRAKYREVVGRPVDEGCGTLIHPTESWMLCTPDGVVLDPATLQRQWGVECKSRHHSTAHQWGEAGTDQVPNDVAMQCHWSMMVTGLKRWDVAALIGISDFRIYTIQYDESLAESIEILCRKFWTEHVLAKVPPAPTANDDSRLGRLFSRHDDQVVNAPDLTDDVRELYRLRRQLKEMKDTAEEIEGRLKLFIGERAGIQCTDWKCTWHKSKSSWPVDWEGVARSLAAKHKISEAEVDEIVKSKTTEKPGSRRFLMTVKEV